MSYFATCGLTNLPILEGQEVVACIIRKSIENTTPSYPFESWHPATAIVFGKYNDYGNVLCQPEEFSKLSLTQKAAEVALRKIGEGENANYGMMRLAETFRLVDSNDNEYERKKNIISSRQPDDFAVWMAHRAVFETLVKTAEIEDRGADGFRNYPICEVVANNRKRIEKAIYDMRGDELTPPKSFLFSDIFDPYGQHHAPLKSVMNDALHELEEFQENVDLWPEFLDMWDRYIGFYNVFVALRKTLQPLGGCGSQANDMQPYTVFARALDTQITSNANYYDEDDECDEKTYRLTVDVRIKGFENYSEEEEPDLKNFNSNAVQKKVLDHINALSGVEDVSVIINEEQE